MSHIAEASGSAITDTDQLLELADLNSDQFGGLADPFVRRPEVASGTLWSPGTTNIGGDTSSPEYEFGVVNGPIAGAGLPV